MITVRLKTGVQWPDSKQCQPINRVVSSRRIVVGPQMCKFASIRLNWVALDRPAAWFCPSIIDYVVPDRSTPACIGCSQIYWTLQTSFIYIKAGFWLDALKSTLPQALLHGKVFAAGCTQINRKTVKIFSKLDWWHNNGKVKLESWNNLSLLLLLIKCV
jgi:hypothetical protein